MTDQLLICAPMRIEARAIRQGLRVGSEVLRTGSAPTVLRTGSAPTVLRTGYGTARAADRAGELKASPFGQLGIMGVGAGLTADLRPGDLVVGTEVGVATCPSAPLLAGELRRAGLPARAGRITTVDHLVRRSERASLAADGTLLADMESAPLAAAPGAAGRASVVLRRRGAGHRDRRAGAGTPGAAGLRAQADRAQHPRGGRPRGP